MAVLKVLHMKEAKTGHPSRHLKNGIQYILNPEKTEDYVEGVHCLPSRAYETMLETKEMVGKLTGRQGYHLIISFDEDTKDKDKCFAVIKAFVSRYLKQNYEAVYCLHTNTNHFHGHIIFNSVSVDGWK